jgi:hypothetical protein
MGEPLGRDWQHPYRLSDSIVAVSVARQNEQKIWARLSGDDGHVYEVFPGGRIVKWPLTVIERRHRRDEMRPARRGPKEKNWIV